MTSEEVDIKTIININKKNIVTNYLKQNPNKLCEQYNYDIISFEQFKSLNISDLNSITFTNLRKIAQLLSIDDLKFMLLNTNYDKPLRFNKMMIHFVCKYSNDDVTKYIINFYIDNNLNLQCTKNTGWAPIHYIFRYSTSEISHIIIDYYEKNKINFPFDMCHKWNILHVCARCQSPDVIIRMINKCHKDDYNMDTCDFNGYTMLHYICKYSTREVINYAINKNVKLVYKKNMITMVDLMKENENLR
jgi:ankyrin repeat protein